MTEHNEQATIPELPQKVFDELVQKALHQPGGVARNLANLAYFAGADAQLKACCEYIQGEMCYNRLADRLRDFFRPKPPNLKEQALKELEELICLRRCNADFATIRRALLSLPDSDD